MDGRTVRNGVGMLRALFFFLPFLYEWSDVTVRRESSYSKKGGHFISAFFVPFFLFTGERASL
ncbi:hypothetical protein F5Y17DRAFT_419058, partial [Xylariaceae sp. FL0594]